MKVQESPLRDVLRIFVWYPLRWLIGWLPVNLAILLLRCMGDIHYYCSRRKKRLLKRNIKLFSVDTQDTDIAVKAYFRNHYIDQLFILIFPKITINDIERLVEIEGLHHLDQSREQQQGVILVHGHFGPVHLPLVVLALLGYPMQQIGNPSNVGLSWIGRNVAYRLRMQYEGMMPAKIIKINDFLRPVFTALKKNEVLMTTGDGSGTGDEFGRQYDCNFLGKNCRMPLGPALLTEKTGAALLPLFVIPGNKKMFRIIIGESLVDSGQSAGRQERMMKTFLRHFEKYIRRYPGYMHFLDRR